MGAECVCAIDTAWRCDIHGAITPEKRAAARYGHDRGPDKLARQEALAETTLTCCGEPRELGHHPACENWTEPATIEIHADQDSLL
jgi:hypothetical protein